MARFATIDIGTNSVLLLVAERGGDGRFTAVAERAEITRLGRGVDRTRTLAPEAIEDTVRVLEQFAAEARTLGAEQLVVSATSAARDAKNGADFLRTAKARAGVTVEIISGEEEAQLSFTAVAADFLDDPSPLVVLDIGGGSTEFIYGGERARRGEVTFRKSFDVGSVRLTERHVTSHPVRVDEQQQIAAALHEQFATLPAAPSGFRLVGVAGTVTTLYSVLHGIDPYDAARVQGGTMRRDEVRSVARWLCDLSLEDRKALKGLQPKRADVICAGALILLCAMEALGAASCTVSDRGLRWGLLAQRFGKKAAEHG